MIRPATAADQPQITRIVRRARLYPLGLHWRRFVVAEEEGGLVGVGQMKRHRGGVRELASLAVLPSRQGSGIATAIVDTMLAKEPGEVYLTCLDTLEPFYSRFGFRRLPKGELPPDFQRVAMFVRLIRPLGNFVTRGHFNVIFMGRPAAGAPPE